MNLDKYTQKSQEAILQAQQIAQDYHHQAIEPAHLLLALLSEDEGVVAAIVSRVAGSPQALRKLFLFSSMKPRRACRMITCPRSISCSA